MSRWTVKVPHRFWETLARLKPKYSRQQMIEIIQTIRDCIEELAQCGEISETGWAEHNVVKPPYSDGMHYEFHIFDDDVLDVYFKRESRMVIRMVGVYDHKGIPSA